MYGCSAGHNMLHSDIWSQCIDLLVPGWELCLKTMRIVRKYAKAKPGFVRGHTAQHFSINNQCANG